MVKSVSLVRPQLKKKNAKFVFNSKFCSKRTKNEVSNSPKTSGMSSCIFCSPEESWRLELQGQTVQISEDETVGFFDTSVTGCFSRTRRDVTEGFNIY